MTGSSKPLVIRDEIHGDIHFDSVLRAVIDHADFQRLRRIQQLGLAYYVFPCASHTRFQHSLGCSFLAGRYFEQVMESWSISAFEPSGGIGTTEFLATETRRTLETVRTHEESYQFWSQVVRLAGLLHDVGHGPWSHTFETLRVEQDFKRPIAMLEPISRALLRNEQGEKGRLKHEEITLLYLDEILRQLDKDSVLKDAALFYLAISPLINKRLLTGSSYSAIEGALSQQLKRREVKGGIEMHRLIRPIISGPFDVDRIDYIQRDGRNCGVFIGGIEWGRILDHVLPCLARHRNTEGEPEDVVLVSSAKNQHILDDFTFSLYQMYAQVYLHPKIVGLEESIRRELARIVKSEKSWKVSLDTHRALSDEKFADVLSDVLGAKQIRKLLMREREAAFEVKSYLTDTGVESELAAEGFEKVEDVGRAFMKDRMGVFLFNSIGATDKGRKCLVNRWLEASPIAREFHSMNYSPRIWVRRRGRNQE